MGSAQLLDEEREHRASSSDFTGMLLTGEALGTAIFSLSGSP